jgi:hypothetical protein
MTFSVQWLPEAEADLERHFDALNVLSNVSFTFPSVSTAMFCTIALKTIGSLFCGFIMDAKIGCDPFSLLAQKASPFSTVYN